ncbi:hypothetical protein NYE69_12710 [Paenibacillus sp. FSL R5-0527]|uniref:hypothetical protein n=1 Tax=Paenibacillus sp. FSL R5-0527 TaxID=2975321 RepID=UPI0030FA3DA7
MIIEKLIMTNIGSNADEIVPKIIDLVTNLTNNDNMGSVLLTKLVKRPKVKNIINKITAVVIIIFAKTGKEFIIS